MRHLAWLFAVAVAFLAVQAGTTTKSAKLSAESLSVDSMNITEIMMRADKNMPVMVIDDPV